jgi:hypothetical protein
MTVPRSILLHRALQHIPPTTRLVSIGRSSSAANKGFRDVGTLYTAMDWMARNAGTIAALHANAAVRNALCRHQDPPHDHERVQVLRAQHRLQLLGQRTRREIVAASPATPRTAAGPRRTVGELLARAEALAESRRREQAARQAREAAGQEAEAAKRRKLRLQALRGEEERLWQEVDQLIATRHPKGTVQLDQAQRRLNAGSGHSRTGTR